MKFLDKWDKYYRIIKRRKKKNSVNQDYVSIYESYYKKLQRKTKRNDVLNVIKGIFFIAVYVFIIFALDEAMPRFESVLGMLVKSSLTFFLLMFISTGLERKLAVPDIIDCFKMLFNALEDIMIILGKGKPSYYNKNNADVVKMEKVPSHKVQNVYHSTSLDKYKRLI